MFTAADIPIAIDEKYTVNSKGDLTGFLNLTMDKAPTIPRDKAIFPEITLVITKVIIGKNTIVDVVEIDSIQFCFDIDSKRRKNKAEKIKVKTDIKYKYIIE